MSILPHVAQPFGHTRLPVSILPHVAQTSAIGV
jgi:hypothetical protein